MTIDDIRARYPNLGISIYAIVPGDPATLEVIDPAGDVFSFSPASSPFLPAGRRANSAGAISRGPWTRRLRASAARLNADSGTSRRRRNSAATSIGTEEKS